MTRITRILFIVFGCVAIAACNNGGSSKHRVETNDNIAAADTADENTDDASDKALHSAVGKSATAVKRSIVEKTELANGYEVKIKNDDRVVSELQTVIDSERGCFFKFSMRTESPDILCVQITVPEGVKEFVNRELGW